MAQMSTPIDYLVNGFLQGREMQEMRARRIVEEQFRKDQADFQRQQFEFDKEQQGVKTGQWQQEFNQRGEQLKSQATDRATDNLRQGQGLVDKLLGEGYTGEQIATGYAPVLKTYGFDEQQLAGIQGMPKSPKLAQAETLAQKKVEAANLMATAKQLSQDSRWAFENALKIAETPEQVAYILNYYRGMGVLPQGAAAPLPQQGAGMPPVQPPMETSRPPLGALPSSILLDTPPVPQQGVSPVSPVLGGQPAAQPDVMQYLLDMVAKPQVPNIIPGMDFPSEVGFDPSKPFGGAMGAQTRARNADAQIKTVAARNAEEKGRLELLAKRGDIDYKKQQEARLKEMSANDRKRLEMTQQKMNADIAARARQIALSERKANKEIALLDARITKLRKENSGAADGLTTANAEKIRGQAETYRKRMGEVKSKIGELLQEGRRLIGERAEGMPSTNGTIELSDADRDARIKFVSGQVQELWGHYDAAKENAGYYQKMLTEAKARTFEGDKPKPPPNRDRTGTGRRGYITPARGSAREKALLENATIQGKPKRGAKGLPQVNPPSNISNSLFDKYRAK
jgi:hypothetical protein